MKLVPFLIGAAVGGPVRYLIDRYFRSNYRFPIGILVVNVFGSFLLGIVVAQNNSLSYGLMGFCGALTTWSALSLDLFDDLRASNLKSFSLNLLLNYGLGVAAALTGLWIAG